MKMASRRSVLALPFAAMGCAAPGNDVIEPFTFRDGVGRRETGPYLSRYTDVTGGFPKAHRGGWWETRYSVDSFSRLDELFPNSVCKSAASSVKLKRTTSEPDIHYDGAADLGAGRFSIDDYLTRNPATGLLLMRDNQILVERYQYARNDRHRLTSFSMAKTVIALLIGIALYEKRIASIDLTADHFVSELKGIEYGATPLRHLLTMSSGVSFREDYDPQDDAARLTQLTIGSQSAGGAAVPTHFNNRLAAPGVRWYYASAETFVLALVLRRCIGQSLSSYLSEKVWVPMGAEADASWLIDASGQEIGYMGLNAVLRDYGRLGMLLANGGQHDGRQLVPASWIADMSRAHFTGAQTGRWYGYGLQTWIFPYGEGDFALQGVRGQAIFVDPSRKLVLVHMAVRPTARDLAGRTDLIRLWRAIKRQV
jgi:CubicO group peptidase (beta-lactamase class C family)